MSESRSGSPKTIFIGFILLFAILALAFVIWTVDAARNRQPHLYPVISPVADFTLTNQAGQVTTLADLTKHVWVAENIFTRSAGPCPRLTSQMKSLQDKLPASSEANW
jgi:protein SCO1/2